MNKGAAAVLDEVKGLICSERASQYGPYDVECERSSKIASLLTGVELKPEHIPLILIAVKMSRETNLHKRDNIVDLVGYAALYEQMVEGIPSVEEASE